MKILNKWNNAPITVQVSVAYALCSILQKGISFITIPIFTRLLSTSQFGQVTIYQSWQAILTVFLTLNLAYGSFSTAMVKYEKDRDGYISSVEGICLSLSLLFIAIYLPLRNLFNSLFELPTSIMLLMVAEILTVNAILLWSGKKRFEFKYKSVILVTILIAVLSPLLQLVLVMNNDEKGFARIIGAAIISITAGGFFYIFNIVKGKKLFSKQYWKYAFGFNIPLLAYYLSQVVFNQSDRLMISHMVGQDKAALYGVACSIAMFLTFLLNAINNSYVPWYYERIKEGNISDNKTVSLSISAIIAFLLLGVIWFAPEIIIVFAGNKYAESIFVVPPVAISLLLLFYAQMFINVEFFYEEKSKLIWASIGSAAANIILNLIFIKQFGFVAAAYTTLISYILFAILNCWAMRSTLKKHKVADEGFNYKGLSVLFLLFSILSYAGVMMYSMLIPRIVLASIAVIIIFIKRKHITDIFNKIKG